MAAVITDRQLVDLAAAIYDPASTWSIGPLEIEGTYFAVQQIDLAKVVVFRGSFTLEDWARDAVSETPNISLAGYPSVGTVPLGFSMGMEATLQKIVELTVGGDVYFTGHSLGASRAGICMLAYASVHRIPRGALFAPARFGMAVNRQLLAPYDSMCKSYHNAFDPVPDLPSRPPWTNVLDHIHLHEPASDWGLFSHHHINLYKQGVYKLFPE